MKEESKNDCKFLLGDWVEKIIDIITFGRGSMWAYKIARLLGYQDCGCEKRRIWLNKLLCKDYKESYE